MKKIKIVLIGLLGLANSSSGQYATNSYTSEPTARYVTTNDIKAITDSICLLIQQHYFSKSKATEITRELKKEISKNKYVAYTHKDSLAQVITADLRKFSNDGHLYVQTINAKKESFGNWEEIEKKQEVKQNYGFTEVQILEHNVGYIKIVEFMHPQRSMQTAIAAMKLVENTQILIIDLRGNGGGYAGIMEYILNHFFEGEPRLLSKTIHADGSYTTTHTSDLLHGKLRVNTPLYILIDRKTASAAEYFAYTLQALRKATIIGEKSAGGANRNHFFDLPSGLRISISIASPVNDITKTNWEGIGVIPDIESADAKQQAVEEIKKKVSQHK